MRGSLVSLIAVACVAASLAAACDAPPDSARPVGAAEVPAPQQGAQLPKQVAATVGVLKGIARNGSYVELAHLAGLTTGFRSNNAGMSHADYWNLKTRTGDPPQLQIAKLFSYRFTVGDSPQGKVYIWPYMAMLKPAGISPADEREIDRLLGPGEADTLRKGAIWPGYVLGIREDGLWLYFVSGSG